MAFKLTVTSTAESDLQNAIDWYAAIQIDLAERFYKAVLKQFVEIENHPHYYSFYAKDYRRTLVKNFPYIIIFRIYNQEVIVNSVVYAGRNPGFIHKRF